MRRGKHGFHSQLCTQSNIQRFIILNNNCMHHIATWFLSSLSQPGQCQHFLRNTARLSLNWNLQLSDLFSLQMRLLDKRYLDSYSFTLHETCIERHFIIVHVKLPDKRSLYLSTLHKSSWTSTYKTTFILWKEREEWEMGGEREREKKRSFL